MLILYRNLLTGLYHVTDREMFNELRTMASMSGSVYDLQIIEEHEFSREAANMLEIRCKQLNS